MNAELTGENQTSVLISDSNDGATTQFNDAIVGWTLIVLFAVVTTAALFGGAASSLRLAFPVGAVFVGAILYFRYPLQYLVFAWWLWFLTPLVRRLIDYRSEWVDPSPVLLAPFLVALLTIVNLTKRDSQIERRDYLPFVLAFAGIIYALGIGIIQNPVQSVAPMLLNWLIPVLFGFHFLAKWREYPQTARVTQNCFLWMTLLTGAYGVYQFLAAPVWDTLWMINGNVWAGGNPAPPEIRVFSTMNSAGPFGVVISAGLLLLFAVKSRLRIPAAIVGYLALMLTLSRTSWLGWLVGLAALFFVVPAAAKAKLLAIVLFLVLLVVPLATFEPFAETIGNRLDTFGNVGEDVSYLDRVEGYEVLFGRAAAQIFGKGLGYAGDDSTGLGVHDSAILEMMFTLGWLGTFLYSCGLILLIFNLLSNLQPRRDVFVNAAGAICLGIFAQILLGSVLIAVSGVVFWSFAGIANAARLYESEMSGEF